MLREIPPGRKVSLEISRDGNVQTLAVELADRKALGHDVWNKIGNGEDVFAQGSGMGILTGRGRRGAAQRVPHADLRQHAECGRIGGTADRADGRVPGRASGLMVKQVARKSEAAAAGLKAFDVILKVGADAVTTLSDWDRALRSNQGKPVQVTILRDRKAADADPAGGFKAQARRTGV